MEQPVGPLALIGIHNSQIKAARFLGTCAEAEVLTSGWAVQNYPNITFISLAGQSNETIALPDERDTVIKLILQAKYQKNCPPSSKELPNGLIRKNEK